MKKNILKATAVWFAFALAGTFACGGGGCGGGSKPAPQSQTPAQLPCGSGTHQSNGQCVANQPSGGNQSNSPNVQAPSQNQRK